ncbi:hypothetical protein DV706_18085 (plasmid) [Natronorubrum bangense]|uniref:Uncharacterized protein n=2 Tax=Natronorubrum bangense TaxID=61858 RepID=L9WF97_9EURY|nr:hypothetical protein C494_13816 [Natronorubrum bangense JCM 10635]QCC56437.1 hypothetical protein DV706_18085 [Natronorubrum bangense]
MWLEDADQIIDGHRRRSLVRESFESRASTAVGSASLKPIAATDRQYTSDRTARARFGVRGSAYAVRNERSE